MRGQLGLMQLVVATWYEAWSFSAKIWHIWHERWGTAHFHSVLCPNCQISGTDGQSCTWANSKWPKWYGHVEEGAHVFACSPHWEALDDSCSAVQLTSWHDTFVSSQWLAELRDSHTIHPQPFGCDPPRIGRGLWPRSAPWLRRCLPWPPPPSWVPALPMRILTS